MKNLISYSLLSLCTVCLFAACGKKSDSGAASAPGGADKSAASTKASSPASGRAIEITGNDAMKFSMVEIHAKPGEPLSVTLTNVGTMPKFSMGHNWILLKKSVDVDAFLNDAMSAATTDYIPASHSGDIIAHTKLLGPKESDTATFNAPSEPGHYPFLCSFPGHYQVGMKGELIVE